MRKEGNKTLKYMRIITFLFLVFAVVLSGCADRAENNPDNNVDNITEPGNSTNDSEGNNSDEYIHGTAVVETIQIMTLESFPVQIHVLAEGNLPDGCTEIDNITQEREGNVFNVTITTKRPKDAICTQALVPFNETIPLEVQGLEAGTYNVYVNGIPGTFVLPINNTLEDSVNSMPPRQQVITEIDNRTSINLKTGETFYLRLKENPTTGYMWQLNLSEGLSVVPGEDNGNGTYYPESSREIEQPLVGSGGVRLWEIKANSEGSQQVNAIYKRIWENTTGNEDKFTLDVEVA